jgi:hypothetical protein
VVRVEEALSDGWCEHEDQVQGEDEGSRDIQMKNWQKRVVTEKAELDKKIKSLDAFINIGVIFNELSLKEQARLHYQLLLMKAYSSILEERIGAFGVTE